MGDVPGVQSVSRVETHLEPGRYRHFKGREYELLAVAKDTETEELVVVYRAAYDPAQVWVRPLAMFVEPVDRGNGAVPRFERIDAYPPFSAPPQGLSRVVQFARRVAERSLSRVITRQSHDTTSLSARSSFRIAKRKITSHS